MAENREWMELKIDDPAFALLKVQIDNLLRDTITKMTDRSSDEGSISIKIMLKTQEASLPYQQDLVEKLSIDWKLTGQIVEKTQTDGNVYDADQFYLDWENPKNPVMRRIPKAQREIHEYL